MLALTMLRASGEEVTSTHRSFVTTNAEALPDFAPNIYGISRTRGLIRTIRNATAVAASMPPLPSPITSVRQPIRFEGATPLSTEPRDYALHDDSMERTPAAGAMENSDIARFVALSTPPDWKAPEFEFPTQSSYYHARVSPQGHEHYQCRSLGQLDFRLFPNVSQATGSIDFGTWRVKHPRFIRPGHMIWWNNFIVHTDRAKKGCAQTEAHPAKPAKPFIDLTLAATHAEREMPPGRPVHAGWLGFCEPTYSQGVVSRYQDVEVAAMGPTKYACAQDGKFADLLVNAQHRRRPIVQSYKTVMWNVIPAVLFVQHYVQNSLPKFAATALVYPELIPFPTDGHQVTMPLDVVANQELQVSRFPIILQFYEHMGWLPPVDVRNETMHVEDLVYPCNLPPLHPLLWQLAVRAVLRMPPPKPLEERRKIVYCGRSRTGSIENKARRVLNEDATLKLLGAWGNSSPSANGTANGTDIGAGLQLVEFDHRAYSTISELIEFWSDARALVGPHGGCLTNLIFMPCNSLLVELMPLVYGRKPPTPHPAMMMYLQSMFLEQEYWMLPSASRVRNGDFAVDLAGLCDILTLSLGPPQTPYAVNKTCAQLLAA